MRHNKIAIAAMSTSGLDYYSQPHNIHLLRLKLLLGQQVYPDDPKYFNNEQFIHWLQENPTLLPKTSPPSRLELTKFFLNLADEGYSDVIFIAMSAQLSQTMQDVLDLIPLVQNKITIHVFNSRSATFCEGWMALEAERLAKQGKSVLKILQHLEMIRSESHVFFGVDDLTYLVKNGRLSSTSQLIANLLQIKPLIKIDKNGSSVVAERVLTTRRAMEALSAHVQMLMRQRNYSVFTLYSGSPKLHQELQTVLTERNGLKQLPAYPVSPVIAAHSGPRSFGIGLMPIIE